MNGLQGCDRKAQSTRRERKPRWGRRKYTKCTHIDPAFLAITNGTIYSSPSSITSRSGRSFVSMLTTGALPEWAFISTGQNPLIVYGRINFVLPSPIPLDSVTNPVRINSDLLHSAVNVGYKNGVAMDCIPNSTEGGVKRFLAGVRFVAWARGLHTYLRILVCMAQGLTAFILI